MKKLIIKLCNKIINSLDIEKKAEAKLEAKAEENDSQKLNAIGETTAILAHDIRKPFASMKAILENIEIFNKNPSKLIQAKRDIDLSIKNVERMINEMMDFSREIKLTPSPSSLNELLEFSINNCSNIVGNAQISLNYNLKHKNKLFVDNERISKIFINLLTNAIEAITIMGGKQRGIIKIVSSEIINNNGAAQLEIRIANDGPQFLKDDKNKLFESFFTKGKKKGTGLGLAVAKKIINLSGGEIYARNLDEGNVFEDGGVEFVITLPTSRELEINKKLPEKFENSEILSTNDELLILENFEKIVVKIENSKKKKVNLLLLEDEILYKNAFKNLIQNENKLSRIINIFDASSFEEAVYAIENKEIDIAVLDIDIGSDKNGFDVLEKAVQKNIYSVMHSNRCIDRDKEKSIALGVKAFLPKPISIKQIFETLIDCYETTKPFSHQKQETENKFICFVDDDSVSRFCFENLMESVIAQPIKSQSKYKIFDSGNNLISNLDSLPKIDFLFTDQNMGADKITGIELLEKIKFRFPLSKCYLLTNEPKHLILEKAQKAGAEDVLSPPLDEEILMRIVGENI